MEKSVGTYSKRIAIVRLSVSAGMVEEYVKIMMIQMKRNGLKGVLAAVPVIAHEIKGVD